MRISRGLVPPGTENLSMNNDQCVTEEREEGEIVDDFEDIISSDEELTMKKRIEELEERNLELEKIANISQIFNYEFSTKDLGYTKDRFELKNLPVSDISDNDELYLPQKTYKVKRRTKKSSKAVTLHSVVSRKNYLHERNHGRDDLSVAELDLRSRTKSRKRKYPKLTRSRSRKKSEKIRKKTISENRSSSEDEFCALNRDELRLALKRDVKVNIRKNVVENMLLDKQAFVEKKPIVLEHIIDLADESEKEEKVIAKEQAKDEKGDTDDSVSLEEQELRLIALKSAIMKKAIKRKKRKESEDKKPYSPSEFVELRGTFFSPRNSIESGPMDISPIASPILVDEDDCNNPIDMDLVSSNSSSPILVGHCGTWIPIDKIPKTKPNNQSSVIMHSPTPINISSSSSVVNTPKVQEKNEADENDTVKINIRSASPEPSDEEEMALRALLLSKMKANKESKVCTPKLEKEDAVENTSNSELSNNPEPQVAESVSNHEADTSLDPEALRQVLLLSMKQKIMNKTEIVLKEAVRRLKSKTQPEKLIHPETEVQTQQENYFEPIITPNVNPFPSDVDYRIFNRSSNFQHNDNPVADIQKVIDNFGNVSINEELKENMHAVNAIDRHKLTDDVPEYANNNLENSEQIKPMCLESVCNANAIDVRVIPEEALITSNNNNESIVKKLPVLPINKKPNFNKLSKQQNLNLGSRTTALKEVPITNIATTIKQIAPTVHQDNGQESNTFEAREESLTNSVNLKSLPIIAPEERANKSPVSKTRSALKTVPMTETVETSNIVKAVNIPKMKTKVIRTRTKVVNKSMIQNIHLKRKSISKTIENSPTKKKIKLDASLLKTKAIPKVTSRLITRVDVPTVKKMIIHLGNSDSESDELSTDLPDVSITHHHNTTHEKDYYDNASPMSLPMDSPCYSPFPNSSVTDDTQNTETPNATTTTGAKKSIVNDIFQARLDAFLKNARNKVEQTKKETPQTVNVLQVSAAPAEKTAETPAPATPLAVRHLPPSSQLEYRRLVNRMKILEKQKQARNNKIKTNLEKIKVTIQNEQAVEKKELPEVTATSSITISSITAPVVPVTSCVPVVTPDTCLQRTIVNDAASSIVSSIKDTAEKNAVNIQNDTLIKKVLKKSTVIPPKPVDVNGVKKQDNLEKVGDNSEDIKCQSESKDLKNIFKESKIVVKVKEKVEIESKEVAAETASHNSKDISEETDPNSLVEDVNLLETVETDYKKNSSYLSENIFKAMELVQVAKEEKTKKLLLQSKLEQLRRDMVKLESELEHRNKILSKIYPQISEHHKCITELKSKCINLEKTAKVVGRKIKGRKYVFKSTLAHTNHKYKEFALEVKNLKDLKIPQFANGEEMTMEEKSLHNEISANKFSTQDEGNITSPEKTDPRSNKTAKQDSVKVDLIKSSNIEAHHESDIANSDDHIQESSSVATSLEKSITKEKESIEVVETQKVLSVETMETSSTDNSEKCDEMQSHAQETNREYVSAEVIPTTSIKSENYDALQEERIVSAQETNREYVSAEVIPTTSIKTENYDALQEERTVSNENNIKQMEILEDTEAVEKYESIENKKEEVGKVADVTFNQEVEISTVEIMETSNIDNSEKWNETQSHAQKHVSAEVILTTLIKTENYDNLNKERTVSNENNIKQIEMLEDIAAVEKKQSIENTEGEVKKALDVTFNEEVEIFIEQLAHCIKEESMDVDEIDHSFSIDDQESTSTEENEQIKELNHSDVINNYLHNILHSTEDIRVSEDQEDNHETINIIANNVESSETSKIKDDSQEGQLQVTLKRKILNFTEDGILHGEGSQLEAPETDIQTILQSNDSVKDIPKNNDDHECNENVNSNLCSLVASNACEEQILSPNEKCTSLIENIESTKNHTCSVLKQEDKEKIFENSDLKSTVILPATNENAEDQSAVDRSCVIEESTKMEDPVKKNMDNEAARSIGSIIGKYVSPLVHLRETRHSDPHGIICPFQLMGQCDDQQCKYEHLPKDTDQT